MNKLDLWLRGFSPTARYEGEDDMEQKHIETLLKQPVRINLTDRGATQDVDQKSAMDAAQIELKAIATPITPEALDAAMWQVGTDGVWYYAIDFANGQFVEVSFPNGQPQVDIIAHDMSLRAKGVKNMHDLYVLYAAIRGDE